MRPPDDWRADEELHPVVRLAAADVGLMQRLRASLSAYDQRAAEAVVGEIAEHAKTVDATFGRIEAARIFDMLCVMLRRGGEPLNG